MDRHLVGGPSYVLFVEGEMCCAPVDEEELDYLRTVVLPAMRPLSHEAYLRGPVALLGSFARHSYVLDGEQILWCVHHRPGLLVLRFSPGGELAYAQLPSRELDGHDPQYHLVCFPWDAWDEGEEREAGFVSAGEDAARRWAAALEPVQELGRQLGARLGGDREARHRWVRRCRNSPLWKGKPL